MANVVSEGTTARGTRTSRLTRAELALATLAAGLSAPERTHSVLEQTLVFTGAAFAGLYTPGGDALCLADAAGVPRTLYGLRDTYSLTGPSPPADAHRTGRPVWLGPEELAAGADSRRMPAGDVSLAAL
ncbi:PAS sensor protein, partial [Streptomyces sp. SID5998]|nr:PAS sensor protein [Streptomyces sp. SID5998]